MCVRVKEIYSHFKSLTHILRVNTEHRSSLGLQLKIHIKDNAKPWITFIIDLLYYTATAIQEVIFGPASSCTEAFSRITPSSKRD